MRTVRLTNGNDTYRTRPDDFVVHALAGNDKITIDQYFADDESAITVYGGAGSDTILGRTGISGQHLLGEDGNDQLQVGHGDESGTARGGLGDDVLRSLGGAGNGNDLYGDAGNDTLYGGPDGTTRLNGGPGRDTLVGGAGDDLFVFFTGHAGTGAARDVIRGFERDGRYGDTIDLSGMDANRLVAGDQAFTFVGNTANPGAAQLGYFRNGGDTIVVGNNGQGKFEIELDQLGAAVSAHDFLA